MSRIVIDRRSFAKNTFSSAAGLAIGSALPNHWIQSLAGCEVASGRVLVVIQLTGGNDGLNTVVPYRSDDYRKARPKLAIGPNEVLKINAELGLHPAMKGMEKLLEAGRLCMIHGVGYPNPNRSHFESMDIWHSCARKEQRSGDGWIGRYIASQSASQTDSLGLHLGSEQQPSALAGRGVQVPSIASIEQFRWKATDAGTMRREAPASITSTANGQDLLDFVQASTEAALDASERLSRAMMKSDDKADFPATSLGEKLRVVSRLILAGLPTRVYYVTLDGFDTHSQQMPAHAGLLKQWSDSVGAFVQRLEMAGQAERVLVITFSEFGRRVSENASEGTDHGAAAPVFFSGPKMGGFEVGTFPSLTDLDDGDLKFHTDFREVYAGVLERWFQVQETDTILAGKFKAIDLPMA